MKVFRFFYWWLCVLLFNFCSFTKAEAQYRLYDTIPHQPKKLTKLVLYSSGIYTVGLIGLNEVWYKENPRQSFQFFNDASEWKQIDKIGHFYSTFHISARTANAINQTGIPAKKSAWLGAATGFVALSAIEILDGYSAAYGASASDLLANASGSLAYVGQHALWNEIRIIPKFSFHRTHLAKLRPNTLGDNLPSEILKDYNGQTYWLSFDMDKFIKFPKWLNLAIGYGGQNMLYANDAANTEAGLQHYRQYYLAVDFDLSSIRTKSKVIKSLLTVVSAIRLPAPALEYNKNSWRFHPFYF